MANEISIENLPNLLLKQHKNKQLRDSDDDESEKAQIRKSYKVALKTARLNELPCMEYHNALCQQLDNLKLVLDQLLVYVECVMVEIKYRKVLTIMSTGLPAHDEQINEQISRYLSRCEPKDMNTLAEVKIKVLLCLISLEDMSKVRKECDQREYEYQLALKNFKIILNAMDIPNGSLELLKDQFDEVLHKYQDQRSVLDKEISQKIHDTMKVFSECLGLLCTGHNQEI